VVHDDSVGHDMHASLIVEQHLAAVVEERWSLHFTNVSGFIFDEGELLVWGRQPVGKLREEEIQVDEPSVLPPRNCDSDALVTDNEP